MEHIEKHTIYVVISITQLISGELPLAVIESYHSYEHSAIAEVEKLKTWKTAAVLPYQVTINDLIRLLNKGLEQ